MSTPIQQPLQPDAISGGTTAPTPAVPATARQHVMIQPSGGQAFMVDAAVSEDHTFENDVTEYPVESGGTITDNIRPKPLQVSLECVVSNTPIDPDIVSARGSDQKPVDDAYAMLQKIRNDRMPATVYTSLRTYQNMALKSLSIPRRSGGASALMFTAAFQQIEISQVDRVKRTAVPMAKNGGTHTKSTTPGGDSLIKVFRFRGRGFSEFVTLAATGIYNRNAGTWIWYDDAIGGWRFGVQPPFSGSVITNQSAGVQYLGADKIQSVDGSNLWIVTSGRPFGVTVNDWNTKRKTDQAYHDDIQAAYNARNGFSASGAPVSIEGLPTNPYDPFNSLNTIGVDQPGEDPSVRQADIKFVHAKVLRTPTLTGSYHPTRL